MVFTKWTWNDILEQKYLHISKYFSFSFYLKNDKQIWYFSHLILSNDLLYEHTWIGLGRPLFMSQFQLIICHSWLLKILLTKQLADMTMVSLQILDIEFWQRHTNYIKSKISSKMMWIWNKFYKKFRNFIEKPYRFNTYIFSVYCNPRLLCERLWRPLCCSPRNTTAFHKLNKMMCSFSCHSKNWLNQYGKCEIWKKKSQGRDVVGMIPI